MKYWCRLLGFCFIVGLPCALAGPKDVERKIAESPVLNLRYGGWTVVQSLVPGICTLRPPSGRFAPAFFDEATGQVASIRGWQKVAGPQLEFLSKDQQRLIRASILAKLDWSRGITFRYGTGKARAILFSAFDCPNCRKFEERLEQEANHFSATLTLFPQTLHANDVVSAEKVREAWCSPNPKTAWRALVAGKKPATNYSGACRLGNDVATELSDMLGVQGVPALVTAEGAVLQGFVHMPLAHLQELLSK